MTQYGPNLVRNGTFATDTDWTKVAAIITGGKGDFNGGGSFSQVLASLVEDDTYQVVCTISDYVAGSATMKLGGTAGTKRSSPATFTENIVCGSTTTLLLDGTIDIPTTAKIDDVTVKKVLDTAPIIEQIAEYLSLAVGIITTAYGWTYDLAPVRRKRVHFADEITADYTVLIFQGDTERLHLGQSVIDWRQPFKLSLIANDSDAVTTSIDTRLNKGRSDIEKKLTEDRTLGGLAYDLQITAPELFVGPDYSGIDVNLDVLYRTLLNDPYTLA